MTEMSAGYYSAGRFLLLVFVTGIVSPVRAHERRAFTPEDLFQLQTVTDVVVSPDGQSVAYVLQRPIAATSSFGRLYLWGNDRADVWVQNSKETEPQNISNGQVDGSGFWKPVWSPDGERLAMLSTRGGDVRLWIWNRTTRVLQLVSERGVSPWPFVGKAGEAENFLWVSDHQLLFWVLSPGHKTSRLTIDTSSPDIAATKWAQARNGRETTASVLESAAGASPILVRPASQLLLANVVSGKIEALCTGTAYGDYDFATFRLAPNHRFVAFLRQIDVWHPDPDQSVKQLINPVYEVVIASLDGSRKTHVLAGVREPFPGSLLWSPDSSEIAVIGYDPMKPSQEIVFQCRLEEQTCHPAFRHSLTLDLYARNVVGTPPYIYASDHQLAIEAELPGSGSAQQHGASTWWVPDGTGRPREFCQTCKDKKPFAAQLVTAGRMHKLFAIIDGNVWRIRPDGVATKNLTPGLNDRISSIERPASSTWEMAQKFVLHAHSSLRDNYYLLDVDSEDVRPLPAPSENARFAGIDALGHTVAFTREDDSGTYVYLRTEASANAGYQTLLETNQFLRDIQAGELRKIGYRSLDGEELKAWVILPYGYTEGRRYPAVVWVQPGTVYGDKPPEPPYALQVINNSHPLNLQLLAAHGYAVLLPSMPVKPYGQADWPYIELMKGVLPAVDGLVETGISDPHRLGVFGQSIGGYGVYGIITQTTRFRAAVASAGFSNLVSLYGTFDARLRYEPFAHEDPFRMWSAETGGMDAPPWRRLEHYILNSPITYAERVQTPLLIFQGDLDYVPIQQGEEFFTALYRQHKRAEFVRYWGEDHLLTSPANIRDMWQRIYTWFDELLSDNNSNADSDYPAPQTMHFCFRSSQA